MDYQQTLTSMQLPQRVNYLWRLLATAVCFTVFGLGGAVIPLIAIPVLYLTSRYSQVRQRRARKLVHWLFKGFVYLLRAMGILAWRTEGLHKLDREGLLLLANHPTLIDIVFLISFVPNADCIVKSRLLNNPATRGFISLAGYITNDQSGILIEAAEKSLAQGSVLVIFPEGTRTRQGQPFKFQRGAANVAVRCRADITPVIIDCSPPTLNKGYKWYHIPERPFVMSFKVCDDISIEPFLRYPPSLGARRLTGKLEGFFTEACQAI